VATFPTPEDAPHLRAVSMMRRPPRSSVVPPSSPVLSNRRPDRCLHVLFSHPPPWLLVWAALLATVHAQTVTPGVPTTLQAARAVLALSPTEAASKLPCRIRGVVTCSNRRAELLFVQDATAGVYIYSQDNHPTLGDVVEVVGTSAQGLFSPIVVADRIVPLGRSELPPPRPIAIEELSSGRHDSQWVEVQGVVIRQSVEWGHLVVQLASGSARLSVRILEFDSQQLPSWVDARVKIRGVAATAYNNRRQLVGFHLLTQSPQFLEVLRPPTPDAFSVPIRSSASLMAYSPEGASEHRTRLQGIVTWAWPGQGFYLRDASGDVRVIATNTTSPQPGDIVEAVGFAAPTLNRPVLLEAVYRTTGQTNPPTPRLVSAREASEGAADSELITLEGVVLKVGERHDNHSALVVEADQTVFRARYQDAWTIPEAHRVVGGKVRVTGVCVQHSPDARTSDGFSLWLRGPEDFSLLEPSPVWRQQQARWLLGGSGAFVLLGAAWVALLRQRVRVQTRQILQREAALEERFLDLFENANDIIYSHDLHGVLNSINKAGQEILGRTEEELLGTSIESLIEPDDIPIARKHIASKIAGAPRTSYEIRVRAKNGQPLVLEVNSRLLFKDGTPAGVHGIARDITDRKEAEEALRSSERQLRHSLEERDRLGRDLHDGIIQSIYAAGLTLDDCTRVLKAEPEIAERRLKAVTADLNHVIRDVRQFIGRLEQDPLSGAEFKSSLQTLASTVNGRSPTRVEVQIEDNAAQRLHSHQAAHLLQVAREALSNSIRHGNASRVVFSLLSSRSGLQFQIQDDGSGFDPSDTDRKGRGLRNIAARADRLGAWLRIQAKPGEGATISLDLPPEEHHEPEHPSPPRR
jgi:PAS domain S-box-containing protein